MKNTIAQGDVLPYVVPAGGVISGGLVLVGSLVGVAVTTGAEDDVVSVNIKGVYEVAKITGAVAQGQALYHNGTASLTTATNLSFQIGTEGDMRLITATVPAPTTVGGALVFQTAGQIAGLIKSALDVALEPVQLGTVTKTVTATGAADANYSVAFNSQI